MGAKNTCKTAAVMGLIGRGPAEKSVSPAPVERTRNIEAITSEILDAKRAGGEAILTIGRGLIEAKALLSHGEWLPWLEERVEFSEKAAQRFMKLAREYSNPTALSDLGATKALMLLAVPAESREAFASELHEVNGEEKMVIDMTSRELDQVIKERDKALMAAAQAQAEQAAAEQAREKISQEMDLANGRIAGLNDLVGRYSAEARERQEELARITAEAGERQEEIARITAELKELKERPVEVAVESDPAAIEAARKEAEAAMRDKLDKAKANQKKAQADLAEVSSALERARLEREQVEAELRQQLAQAEKKAALASNEDFVLFKTILERLQEDGNRLCGLILKERNKDQERAERFSNAFFACLDKMRKEAQG